MISRRAFLKAGAVVGGVLTAATVGWGRLSADDLALARDGRRLGALLAPADHVAWLIQTGAVSHLAGTPGRPHDPEGQYSAPFRLRGLTVHLPDGSTSLRRLQQIGGWWPADARTAIAAALLAGGFSPNATDAAALAQSERWLRSARPRVTGSRALAAGGSGLTWQDLDAPGFRTLTEGLLVSEWDWVILAHAPKPHLAEDFIRRQASTWRPPPAEAILLSHVPPTASFAICRIFERVAIGAANA